MSPLARPFVARYRPSGKSERWVINGLKSPDGKRTRRFFSRKEDAESALNQLLSDPKWGTAGALTPDEIAEASSCIQRLTPFGKSLTDATDELLRRIAGTDLSMTIANAVTDFREFQTQQVQNAEIKVSYASDLRNRIDDFTQSFGERCVASVRPLDIDHYLRSKSDKPATRNSRLRALSVFFSWCVLRGIIPENPTGHVHASRVELDTPCILSPAQLSELLRTAAPDCIPAIAIAAFAGVRAGELRKLDWSDVKLAERVIEIGAVIAKTHSRRTIPISDNLLAWLSSYGPKGLWERKARGKIVPKNFRRKLEDARDASGLEEPDGSRLRLKNHLRHSFGSYRLSVLKNEQAVAIEMGNSPEVIHSLYKNSPAVGDIAAWWAVAPAPRVRVI